MIVTPQTRFCRNCLFQGLRDGKTYLKCMLFCQFQVTLRESSIIHNILPVVQYPGKPAAEDLAGKAHITDPGTENTGAASLQNAWQTKFELSAFWNNTSFSKSTKAKSIKIQSLFYKSAKRKYWNLEAAMIPSILCRTNLQHRARNKHAYKSADGFKTTRLDETSPKLNFGNLFLAANDSILQGNLHVASVASKRTCRSFMTRRFANARRGFG